MAENRTLKKRACILCTRAKRKCDRQTPSCARCTAKGFMCRYPAPRIVPSYDIIYGEHGTFETVPATTALQGVQIFDEPCLNQDQSPSDPTNPIADTLIPVSNWGSDPLPSLPWYLTTSSWDLSSIPRSECLTFEEESLKSFIRSLQNWMKQWTSHGHCAFIHRSLYSDHMPVVIQDAYTTLAAYQNKTPTNRNIILRICKERLSTLIECQSLDSVDSTMRDTSMHLSRTQALIVYISICLFDGDINARARAEQGLDVLMPWGHQLIQSASSCSGFPATWNISDCGISVPGEPTPTTHLTPCLDGNLDSFWRSWAHAESIRRTYLIVVLLVTIYSTLKTGWSGCPGGVTFTGDEGLWDASSAHAWKRVMKGVNEKAIGFMPIFSHRMGDVLANRKPADVDDFTCTLLDATFGRERLEGWRAL
ncbi:High-affinity methionine permease [Fusarium oxysporum f. sp. albedinis]|nr:High-affinity methionine permease [Fusarium oxysporum f. sp. albedinis]KAK2477094.1 hypothetical protein H9L39_12318 [Fusarium oxysporum f. sp. albedinis]